MDDKTTKIIKEKFDSLPESVKEVILSSHYEETLIDLGKKYGLTVEQLGILERETTLVMMGLTPVQNFTTELTRELVGIDKTKIPDMVKDLNEKIFLKIRELLKIMSGTETEEPDSPDGASLNETQILNSAGIKLTGTENLNVASPDAEKSLEPREEILKRIEISAPVNPTKEESHPILAQKLSGSVQIPTVKTEHTLENITKISSLPQKPEKSDLQEGGYKADPYREIPE